MKSRLAFLCFAFALIAATLIPLWGIRIPILVDLPEQLAVAKLFAEKVSGQSALNLEVSSYWGYRFFALLVLVLIRLLVALHGSFAALPTLVAMALVVINGAVLIFVMRQWTATRPFDGSWLLVLFPL